jgi:hypothetical protein
MSEQAKSEQVEIGALWKKEGKSQKFLAGNLDFSQYPDALWNEFIRTKKLAIVSFTNKFKQKDTHPDLRIYLSKPKDAPAAPAQAAAPAPAPADSEII